MKVTVSLVSTSASSMTPKEVDKILRKGVEADLGRHMDESAFIDYFMSIPGARVEQTKVDIELNVVNKNGLVVAVYDADMRTLVDKENLQQVLDESDD